MSEEYGITSTGFNPKPVDVLEDEAKELLKQYFGSNVDVSQQSPLWKLVQVSMTELSTMWLKAEQNFYNCFIQTAEGISLDLLAEDVGLERKDAISATVELTIYKNTSSSVTVPAGYLFQTAEGIVFSTDEEITIPIGDPSTTTGTVDATATVAGLSGNVSSGTITTPTNTISGVDSSNNASVATGGEDIESDTDFRKRINSFVRSTWTRDAIRSAALNVDGVSAVKIIEEATSYRCLIVPQTSYTAELETAIEEAIEPVTPVTVEFTVEESTSVLIIITADAVIESTYTETAAENDVGVEIDEYISDLDLDDDVLKAKVIQAVMEVAGIINAYNFVLKGRPFEEKHTYSTGTLTYNLDYSTGNTCIEVKGTVGGSPHTFTSGTDYNFNTSPARIVWTGTGSLPDNGTDFKVTYEFPANAIGDVEINQDSIAKYESINFTII